MTTEPQMLEHATGQQIEHSDWSPLKTVLAMAIGATLGAGVYVVAEARHSKQQTEHALPALRPSAAATTVAEAPKEAPPIAEQAPQPSAAQAEAEDPAARAQVARNAAEQALLDEARTQLDARNASAAQATLERMKKRFARGSLVQERELLRIEVYKARGQMPAAKRAARKFAKAYPDSPHLDELDALIKI